MNKVILIGNVTKDVELSTSNNGKNFANFTLAVSRGVENSNGDQETDFINCVAFNKTAENLAKFVKKGNKLAVVGKLQIDSYIDTQGVKKYSTKVVVNEDEFLTPKTQDTHPEGFNPIDDDDSLPF